MGKKTSKGPLTKAQITELRDIINAERERIENKLNLVGHQNSLINSDSGKDEVDSANEDIMRRSELRFATREALYLKKIHKTIKLMDTEGFGCCEECGADITFTRLKARPTSTLCILCKEESERDEQRSYHGRISKSLTHSAGMA